MKYIDLIKISLPFMKKTLKRPVCCRSSKKVAYLLLPKQAFAVKKLTTIDLIFTRTIL